MREENCGIFMGICVEIHAQKIRIYEWENEGRWEKCWVGGKIDTEVELRDSDC